MTHVELPAGHLRKLPFYLAMEEWVAANMPSGEWFFTWRVAPTVIFGRNQQPATEVDLEYCRRHGIEVYRRRSGGGCVYADIDNIMMSFVSSCPSALDVASTFARYTSRIAAMLKSLGLDAEATGRNDVTVGGKKVSGNAFYHLPGGRSISHGTMLFSTDMGHMLNAITPSRSKLESKRVKSVGAHITTLSEHLPGMTIEEFESYAISHLTYGSVTLTPEQVREIEEIEQKYYKPSWLWGASAKGLLKNRKRIEGVGELAVYTVENPADGTIASMEIHGDFFPLGDISRLTDPFKGKALDARTVAGVLEHTDPGGIVAGLTGESFSDLLLAQRTE